MEAIPPIQVLRNSPHPWFLWKDVTKPQARVPPGSVVEIIDRSGQWLGRGFYNGHARIRLRVLTRSAGEAVDKTFFETRLERALEWRQRLRLAEVTNTYRVVNAEGDGLGGLVIDRFDDLWVIEYFSAGMYRFRTVIKEVLSKHFPTACFYEFAERHIQKQESFDCRAQELPPTRLVREYGVNFEVVPGSLHKTGFFTDQRDNRQKVAEWSRGKTILDICSHSGGFAIAALKAGATRAVGLDKDPASIEIAARNASLNEVKGEWINADLLDWLPASPETFDTVVLDPPKQTRSREGLAFALKNYYEMNRLALRRVAPGGILFTCSCTGLVKESQFLEAFAQAATASRRQVQIFHLSGAGADHPFLADVPEGRYLKAIASRVV